MADLEPIENEVLAAVAACGDETALETLRVAELGKKGRISALMRALGTMDAEARRETGSKLNALRDRVSAAIQARKNALYTAALDQRLQAERADVTLDPLPAPETQGRVHPVSQVSDEILAIFADMGFAVAEGPDVESDEMNFTALNIPPEHPARQMHDTFYLEPEPDGTRHLLRTHTSPVQIRAMRDGTPPYRLIVPGRTYRCDYDQTHTPMFHQVEALVIDRDTHMGHLKWTIEAFARAFFEVDQVKMRFRPSHFPFTEPSAEVDIGYHRAGDQLILGEGDDWLEIMGCGMVHPKVLAAGGLDPAKWQGFAFGMGIDRIAMLKYGIADLRSFFDSDLRWLRHYGFAALDIPSLYGGLSR